MKYYSSIINFVKLFFIFISHCYKPLVHIVYSVLICLSLDVLVRILGGIASPWQIQRGLFSTATTFFLLMLYVRAADEIKDLPYDRKFNPTRPLATGILNVFDVTVIMIVTLIFVYLINAKNGFWEIFWISLVFFHSTVLIFLERWNPLLGDRVFVSLLLTFPLNILCNLYVCAAMQAKYGKELGWKSHVEIIATISAIFLTYEFLRKIAWPQHGSPGQRFYSASAGVLGALSIAIFLAVLGLGSAVFLAQPWDNARLAKLSGWALGLPILFILFGIFKFAKFRKVQLSEVNPKMLAPYGTAYLASSLILLVIHGAILWGFSIK